MDGTGSFWDMTLLMGHEIIYLLQCVMHIVWVVLELVSSLNTVRLYTASVYF